MKKTLTALIILALIFSLSACGRSKDADGGTDGASQTGDPKDSEMQSDTDADTEQENAEGSDAASSDMQSNPERDPEPGTDGGTAEPPKTETDKPSTTQNTKRPEPTAPAATPVTEPPTPVTTPVTQPPAPVTTPQATSHVDPPAPEPAQNNIFFNESNNTYDAEQVTVKPRYVYWKDGRLIAECFVINGCSVPVSDINVQGLAFANKSVNIASAAFGPINGVVLQPYTYIVWTFEFGSDTVMSYGADLNWLICNCNVSFDRR